MVIEIENNSNSNNDNNSSSTRNGIFITNATGRIGLATLKALCQIQRNSHLSLGLIPEPIYIGIEKGEEKKEKEILEGNQISFQNFPFIQFIPINFKENAIKYETLEFLKTVQTIFVIPSTRNEKIEETMNILSSIESSKIPNILLFSILDPVDHKDKMRKQYYEFEDTLKSKIQNQHNGSKSGGGQQRYKILRAGFFMENLNYYKDEIKYEQRLSLPIGEGKIAPVSVNDVGIIASKILLNFDQYPKSIYSISGSQYFTGKDISQRLSQYLNQKITYQPDTILMDTQEMKDNLITNIIDIPQTSESRLHNTWLNEKGLNSRCLCHKPNDGKNEVESLLELCESIAHEQFNQISSDSQKNFGWMPMSFDQYLENLCKN
ncbi:hypothetical protein H8356DRAFT_1426685 [Neocallimastix lanati (nom. inval.)]|nr:hypothetical protein H8356DRAFT_1426685 [Neocallimastix sp. JGI-2020a]